MNAKAKNMEAIYKAISDHNGWCEFPAHTILMHPHEIARMGWEEGDDIRGCRLTADPTQGTGAFRLLCDKDQPKRTDDEEIEVKTGDKVFALGPPTVTLGGKPVPDVRKVVFR